MDGDNTEKLTLQGNMKQKDYAADACFYSKNCDELCGM